MKKFFAEFKEFISQGNVVDMAVGVVVGAAFRAIIDSFIENIISPLIGLIFHVDFSELSFGIGSAQIMYGAFIMSIINFILVAFVLFCFVKAINRMKRAKKKEEEEAAPATKKCPYCLSDIPIEATRCPHCTSELPEEEAAEA